MIYNVFQLFALAGKKVELFLVMGTNCEHSSITTTYFDSTQSSFKKSDVAIHVDCGLKLSKFNLTRNGVCPTDLFTKP